MCGIFGIINKKEKILGETLIEACKRLSYRGYDSVGCASVDENWNIDLRKDVGKVEEVSQKLCFSKMKGFIGIAQLRWATFGAPSKVNAQPHFDSGKELVGAHNGNVVNNIQLREMFLKEGMVVRSTNDGESCVHAVEYFIKRGFETEEAVRKATSLLEGDYAFLLVRKGEKKIYAVKKGSGLVIGIGEDGNYVSSDLPSLLFLTKKILRVEDGEMAIIEPSRITVKKIEDGSTVEKEPEVIKEEMESVKKGGFAHFMLKEIFEQPKVAMELLHLLNASPIIEKFTEKLNSARNIYFIGCGTSYHACLFGSVAFAQYSRIPAIPVLAPQFIMQYLPTVDHRDIGIFVSQSGETKDVLRALEFAKEKKMQTLGLVNVLGSSLMKMSDFYLPLACGYEISVPATKTFTNQALTFLYLAARMGNLDTSILMDFPKAIQKVLDQSEKFVKEMIPLLKDYKEYYCLGYGFTYPIALEGALKIKEVTYSHCEGMLSTEFKHGPLSSVKENYPVIFVVSKNDIPVALSGINEVSCRGGNTIVISSEDERLKLNSKMIFAIPPSDDFFQPLVSVVPLQLLAYYLSVEMGFDPDFPRNLSKTLTVD